VLTPLAAVSTDRLNSVCGDPSGFFCREVLNRTDDRTLAEIADFIIGKPLTILAILLGASVVNRMVSPAQYAIAPIDLCYGLVGLVKANWEGISGGSGIERAIEGFFDELRERGSR